MKAKTSGETRKPYWASANSDPGFGVFAVKKILLGPLEGLWMTGIWKHLYYSCSVYWACSLWIWMYFLKI